MSISLQDLNIYEPYLKVINNSLESLIQDGGKKPILLDGGCGHSTTLDQQYKLCGKVIGVDLDKRALEINDLVDEKIVADLTSIPIADCSVDIFTCAWVLEHIAEPDKFVAEVNRVLKPGGYFIFITPNRISPAALIIQCVPSFLHGMIVKILYKRPQEDTFRTFYRMNTEKKIDKLFVNVNFVKKDFIYNDDIKFFGFSRITRPIALIWHRIVMKENFRSIRANIIGSYNKV